MDHDKVLNAAAGLDQPFTLDALKVAIEQEPGALLGSTRGTDADLAGILYLAGYEGGTHRRPYTAAAVRVFYKPEMIAALGMENFGGDFVGPFVAGESHPVVDGQRLHAAATALYEAGHWRCDRPCDEVALWTELRDALGRTPGAAPRPLVGNPNVQ